MSTPDPRGCYEALPRITLRSLAWASPFLFMALLAGFSDEDGAALLAAGCVTVASWVTFGPLVLRAAGRPALRVDADGILLGRTIRPRLVPWSEVRAVVEFTERSFDHLGVLVPNHGRSRLLRTYLRAPGVGPDSTAVAMVILGWRLDRRALAAAVAVHAPRVPVLLSA